jgi:predicted AlkP superfamily phosphohydrolase/phosphomutase
LRQVPLFDGSSIDTKPEAEMQPKTVRLHVTNCRRGRAIRFGTAMLVAVGFILAFFLVDSPAPTADAQSARPGVVVLGFDGLDPRLVEQWMDEGLLPNFARLREAGTYARLQTTNPAESPVAWSVFSTGLNPGRTAIFGFLKRDPTSYQPYFAPTLLRPGKLLWGWLPLRPPRFINLRRGTPFWEMAAAAGIKATVLFCPETFPASPFEGRLLSGPETPDLAGTAGSFVFYTSDSSRFATQESVDRMVAVSFVDGVAETVLRGPQNWTDPQKRRAAVPLRLRIISLDTLEVEFQDNRIHIAVGEWSPWLSVKFPMKYWVKPAGVVRFYLRQLKPELQLYRSPVNIDPRRPAFRISHPPKFAGEAAEAVGLYKTLGWGADTWALNDGFLDERAFLQDAWQTFDERRSILRWVLNQTADDLIVAVFNSTDRVQHMFWRSAGKNPGNGVGHSAIRAAYQRADSLVGDVLERVGPDATVLVLSDHGFAGYRRSVNLNNWLEENEYLVLREAGDQGKRRIAWSETRAYSIGLGGIYLNVRGREKSGVVPVGAAYDTLRTEIRRKLLAWRDLYSGEKIVEEVYLRENLYQGPYAGDAPDLVVGLRPGYRVSQRSSLGELEREAVRLNQRRWSGDHVSVDPRFVPGVLLVNRPLPARLSPSMIDLAPTILSQLGVSLPPELEGRDLFGRERQ